MHSAVCTHTLHCYFKDAGSAPQNNARLSFPSGFVSAAGVALEAVLTRTMALLTHSTNRQGSVINDNDTFPAAFMFITWSSPNLTGGRASTRRREGRQSDHGCQFLRLDPVAAAGPVAQRDLAAQMQAWQDAGAAAAPDLTLSNCVVFAHLLRRLPQVLTARM